MTAGAFVAITPSTLRLASGRATYFPRGSRLVPASCSGCRRLPHPSTRRSLCSSKKGGGTPTSRAPRLLSTVSVSSDCGVCGTDSFLVQTNTTPTFTVGRESGCVLEDMIAQRDAGTCSSCMVNRARGDWYYNAPRDTWVCHDDLDGTVPSAGKSCTSLLTLPAVLPITIGRHTLPWPSMNFAAVDFPVVGLDLAPLLAFEPVSVHDSIYIELAQPQHSF